MKGCLLEFKPIIDNIDLVPSCIYNVLNDWKGKENNRDFLVAEINPE